jgi:predicted dehydrogenase
MGGSRARTVAKTAGARLAAVCDINEERGRRVRQEHGCEWIADYAKMLERDDVEVVMVMTPSGMHAEMGIQAAQAGKHVVVAKPLDVTLEKADKLIAACRKAGVTLAVDFDCRYVADNWKVRTAIERNLFGRLILGEVRLKWWRTRSYYENRWRGTWAMDGGGSLMNQGVHSVDLLQWFMGPVESVFARCGTFAHQIETEDLTMAMLRFSNGAVGTILTTTTFPNDAMTRIEIHGDKGGVMTAGNRIEFWMTTPDFNAPQRQQNPADFACDYTGPGNAVQDMLAVVREGRQPNVSGEEGRKSLEIILAIYESARTGKEVKLPLPVGGRGPAR